MIPIILASALIFGAVSLAIYAYYVEATTTKDPVAIRMRQHCPGSGCGLVLPAAYPTGERKWPRAFAPPQPSA